MNERNSIGAPVLLDRVTKSYGSGESGVLALTETTMTISPGEFVVLLGPSGCGKTTLLRMIAGLLPPTGGGIRLGDDEIWNDGRLAKSTATVGMVFQEANLLPWRTVAQNIAFPLEQTGMPKKARAERAEELCSLVGIEGFEDRLPAELSGGMRQRAAIARALSTNPNVLLMDEPFGALDAFTRDRLNAELQDIWMRTRQTIILVTHSISEAVFLADRVVLLSPRPGRVVDVVPIEDPRPRGIELQAEAHFQQHVLDFRARLETGE